MTYFDPTEPPEHRCALPAISSMHKGWRCTCGKAYVVEMLPDRDVNPGELPYQWRRSPKHDEAGDGE